MKKLMRLCFFFSLQLANLLSGHDISNKIYETLDLYPNAEPYDEGYLDVSELHRLYYAQFGNPKGLPIVVVHGGPGAGCSPQWSSFFDLTAYRVIMFDQRGSYRSKPLAELKDNTPQNSVADMEALREHLGIDKWVLFGGSWGSALSILYGETHPDRSLGFVLRGIFLGRENDYKHLFYGMRNTFPEAWDEMVQTIPEDERNDLLNAIHKRVMDTDTKVSLPAAHAFMRYDTICGTLLPNPQMVQAQAANDESAISVSKAFMHYSANKFFLSDNQLLKNIGKIAHLPCILVQGRYDTICPASTAFDLHQVWNNSKLWYVANAGHFSTEPHISRGLREALDEIKILLNENSSAAN